MINITIEQLEQITIFSMHFGYGSPADFIMQSVQEKIEYLQACEHLSPEPFVDGKEHI